MSLTTTGGASMPVKTLRTRSRPQLYASLSTPTPQYEE
jgi:hypothetical protein